MIDLFENAKNLKLNNCIFKDKKGQVCLVNHSV